jgi:dihydrofolate synthase/folylpolyglutamate synthase
VAAEARRSDVVLERLIALHPKLIDLALDRVEGLLARLGHPETRLPPAIHVAGTNGKGSVVAFMRAICEAAGLALHVYTSPHLVRFAERIVVAGRQIEEDALLQVLEECEAANGGLPITFFEVTTAAAFLAFARSPADVTLLETGLGGRFDATNVLARPAATIITPISLDHMAFLGPTVERIAFEKAGILKPGVPCILSPQPEDARRVVRARAAEVGAPVLEWGADWRCAPGAQAGMVYEDRLGRVELPLPSLPGAHQIENAGAAIAALRTLGRREIGDVALARGVQRATWPARLQRLVDGRYVALLPEGWELWLDGGHNPGAAEVVAQFLRGWTDRPLHLVVGMLNTRDPGAFLAPIAPFAASIQTLAIRGEKNTWTAAEAAAAARRIGFAAHPAEDVASAIARIASSENAKSARRPGRILICGSLYLAGTVLAGAA